MPLDIQGWGERKETTVNRHKQTVITAVAEGEETALTELAPVIRDHYAAPDRIAHILEKFGKDKSATYVREKMPTSKTARSADMGEILCTEYIDANTEYAVPVKRLRWKEHREMAMRGEDAIGVLVTEDGPIRFLKVEAKSREALSTKTVTEARGALDSFGGYPSVGGLGYVADRLYEEGDEDLADLITAAQLEESISARRIAHMLFAFSGNDPGKFLKADLTAYGGQFRQGSVGLRIKKHQEFIASAYDGEGQDDDT